MTIATGLIATMTALLLGLVMASAKSSFDAVDTAILHSAQDALALDRTWFATDPRRARSAREPLRFALGQLNQ